MKLHLTQVEDSNLITAYETGVVEINKQRHSTHLIVMPTQLVLDWSAKDFQNLTSEDFNRVAELNPEVVLLGTGDRRAHV